MLSSDIDALLSKLAHRFGDRVALANCVGAQREAPITYRNLLEQVRDAASALSGEEGPVALLLDNGSDWVIAFLAAARAGRTIQLLDPSASPKDVTAAVLASGTRLVIASSGRVVACAKAWAQTSSAEPCRFVAPSQAFAGSAHPDSGSHLGSPVQVEVQRAGGKNTYGLSSLIGRAVQFARDLSIQSSAVLLTLCPLSSGLGVQWLLASLLSGAELLFVASRKPVAALQAIRSAGVSHLLAPPEACALLAQKLTEQIGALPSPKRQVAQVGLQLLEGAATWAPTLLPRAAHGALLPLRTGVGHRLRHLLCPTEKFDERVARQLRARGLLLHKLEPGATPASIAPAASRWSVRAWTNTPDAQRTSNWNHIL